MKKVLFSVWEGVYQSFSEAGGDSDAFDTDFWLNRQKNRIIEQVKQLCDTSFIPDYAISKDYPLAIIVGLLLDKFKKINILDFGGGMGEGYLELLAKVPKIEEKLKYCIVENQSTINNIPHEIGKYKNLNFFSSYEHVSVPIHIIHVGSSLQYINRWKELLVFLRNKFKPEYFVFSDLPAGKISSFVTHQISYEKKIPCWFFCYDDIKNFMDEINYEIKYHSYFSRKILGQDEIFPNHGLPEKVRIRRAMNIVFNLKRCN